MIDGPPPAGPLSGGFVVTIDGPAGSGKSTTAREVARRLGFRHLDSGALYRAMTLAILRAGWAGESGQALEPDALDRVDLRLEGEEGGFRVLLEGVAPGEALRSEEVTALAPRLARDPGIRVRLVPLQRSARAHGGLVADGRDMGTVIFPDAEVKVFLTASLEERVRRRLLQEGREATPGGVALEAARIRARDEMDAGRSVAPLRPAPDAFTLDTTGLSFEAQVSRIVEVVRERMRMADGLTGKPSQE